MSDGSQKHLHTDDKVLEQSRSTTKFSGLCRCNRKTDTWKGTHVPAVRWPRPPHCPSPRCESLKSLQPSQATQSAPPACQLGYDHTRSILVLQNYLSCCVLLLCAVLLVVLLCCNVPCCFVLCCVVLHYVLCRVVQGCAVFCVDLLCFIVF